jgi:ABC-type sugar transport system substrate-binding protein
MSLARLAILALVLALALPAAARAAEPKRYLVSLGDSYATGYQATGAGEVHNTRNGFAYCELRDIHARTNGYRLIAKLIVKTLPRR